MFDPIFKSISAMKIEQFLLTLGIALIIGVLSSFVNIKTQKSLVPNRNMFQILVILPMLVAVIIMLVGTNMASALSLGGAFAIIRFRSTAEPKDISYVLVSMAVGLALGMGYVGYAVVASAIFMVAMIALSFIKFGEDKLPYKLLKIKMPENLNSESAFIEILSKYTVYNKLLRIKTSDLGTIYELSYVIQEKKSISEKELIDELRVLNGNLTISIVMYVNGNSD